MNTTSTIKKDVIWVVDDDASIRWVLSKALEQSGRIARSFDSGDAAVAALERSEPDAIVTDIRMPGIDGLALLDLIQTRAPHIPVIVMTAHTDLDSAVSSYKGGAFEYLPKPFDIDDAVNLIERASEQRKVAPSLAAGTTDSASQIIGEAPAMQEVFRAVGRLSGSHLNVLVCGESGTGKELVARALFENSPRSDHPFIAINTAAIPSELLESELFGHEKGSFTGATGQHRGRFEQANGGTLFLDEIGDMPAPLQTRLLRVLSDGRFYRVGGREQIEVDVRIIAATNQNLESRVSDGRFREDLFHRLNVIRITLPSLRERREDIPALIKRFMAQSATELNVEAKLLDQEALDYLSAHDWPGNVRQLENVCRWITVMAPSQTVSVRDLPDELDQGVDGTVADRGASSGDWTQSLSRQVQQRLEQGESRILDTIGPQFERLMIEVALRHTRGHKQEAARRLGWGRNTLTRKLKELGIDTTR